MSAAGSSSPAPGLFAERLRASLPAPAADGTVLLCGVRPASAPVEAVEGAAPLPPVGERQAEATGAEPPLPGAPEGTASARKRCRRRREGHPYQIFFRAPATARAAMRSSTAAGGRPCSGSVASACRHALERVLRAGEALARTTAGAETREQHPPNLASPAAIKACRYRPDILQSVFPSR